MALPNLLNRLNPFRTPDQSGVHLDISAHYCVPDKRGNAIPAHQLVFCAEEQIAPIICNGIAQGNTILLKIRLGRESTVTYRLQVVDANSMMILLSIGEDPLSEPKRLVPGGPVDLPFRTCKPTVYEGIRIGIIRFAGEGAFREDDIVLTLQRPQLVRHCSK